MQSWRPSTQRQYSSYNKQDKNPYSPTPVLLIEFLTQLYDEGFGYSALNSARCAVSSLCVDCSSVGQHTLIKRFFRGVFNLRPSLPRYTSTWDTNIVLAYLEKLKTNTLRALTFKVATLLALLAGQRVQSLSLLDIEFMTKSDQSYVFKITDLVKQSRPGYHISDLTYPAFPSNPKLCIVRLLEIYTRCTQPLRKTSKLLITLLKPHTAASKETISRWIKSVLQLAGIDINKFKPHSVRSASTSAAKRTSTPLVTIMKTAGWSRASTFATYYNKPITAPEQFANNILHNFQSEKLTVDNDGE